MCLEAVLIVFSPILSAIVNGQPCTLGTPDLQQSSANPTPGLFIQQQDRAPCSGVITQWTVCYYNPATITDRKTFQILLEVWRNEPTSRFENMGANSVSITIPDQPEDFQCLNITIDADDRIDVNEGDFLGVYVPGGSNLPVVTTNSGITDSRVFFVQVSDIPPITVVIFGSGQPRATQLFNHGIHVTATIAATPQLPVTSSKMDYTTSTTSKPHSISTYSSKPIIEEVSTGHTPQPNNSVKKTQDTSKTTNRSHFTAAVATSTAVGILILLLPLLIAIVIMVIIIKKTNSNPLQPNQTEYYNTVSNLNNDNDIQLSRNDSYGVVSISSPITVSSVTQETNISDFHHSLVNT